MFFVKTNKHFQRNRICQVAPVIYLTPDLTRAVRFPRNYAPALVGFPLSAPANRLMGRLRRS